MMQEMLTSARRAVSEGPQPDELLAALLRRAARPDTAPFALRVPPELADQLRPAAGATNIEVIEDTDNGREFLDCTLAVRVVDGVGQAIDHIRRHGSGHTEGMIGTDTGDVDLFCARVDAACLVVNGSLRLDDGPTMGLGPELSISTGRLHVRGPVTLGALLTHSWVVHGHGATRPDQADPQRSLPEQEDPEQSETEQTGCAELPMRGTVSEAAQRLVLWESRSPLSPQDIGEDKPLSGTKLRANSFGFVGMLGTSRTNWRCGCPTTCSSAAASTPSATSST